MMGLSKITIVNLRTITFSESFFTCFLRRSQPVGMWRLSTKHSKAMKNGRLFIELGKGTNSNYYQMIIINATNFTSKCLVFFLTRISNFFPVLVNFFQQHAPLAQWQSSSLLSYWSGVQIPDGAPQVNTAPNPFQFGKFETAIHISTLITVRRSINLEKD